MRFNFSTDLCFTLAHIDERFVAHDFLSLVELALQLRGDFLFLACLEGLKTLFHFDLQFKGGLLLEQVEVRLVREAFVAKLCIHFGHDGLAGCGFPGLEFKVKPFRPILLAGVVLSLELFTQFGFSLVAVAGQSVLDLCFSGVSVGGKFVLFPMLKFGFNLGLEASGDVIDGLAERQVVLCLEASLSFRQALGLLFVEL